MMPEDHKFSTDFFENVCAAFDDVRVMRGGTCEWWEGNHRHREDGPSVIRANGYQVWFRGGKLHRIDGPAIIGSLGRQEWWINGVEVDEKDIEEIARNHGFSMEVPLCEEFQDILTLMC